MEKKKRDLRRLINLMQEYSYNYKNLNLKDLNAFIDSSMKKNNDVKLLIKNVIKSKDYYVLNSNKINLYIEIDKRDINNNYDYLFAEK